MLSNALCSPGPALASPGQIKSLDFFLHFLSRLGTPATVLVPLASSVSPTVLWGPQGWELSLVVSAPPAQTSLASGEKGSAHHE